jgi:hypothetical protein
MRRVLWAAVAAAVGLSALVPGTSGAWTAAVQDQGVVGVSPWYTCASALSALASSSVFQWRLVETGTAVADVASPGLAGTWKTSHGMAASSGPGGCRTETSQVAAFDGSSGWVGSGQSSVGSAFAGAFSEAAWIRTAPGWAGGGDVVLLCNADMSSATCASRDYRMYLTSSGALVFAVAADQSGNVWTVTTGATVNDGAWHLVAGTMSSSEGMRVYIDGQDVTAGATAMKADQNGVATAKAAATMTGGRSTASGYWRVGAGDGGANWLGHSPAGVVTNVHLAGNLLDVGVYKRTLTANEIASLYAAGR